MYYSYYNSPVGIIEISASDHILSGVDFVKETGSDKESNSITESLRLQIHQYFIGERTEFKVDIEFGGTDFQNRVWKELTQIPFGQTITYKELAQRVDSSKAYRAVGNANNKNRYAIVVPCHRVIGSSGKLVGYAGGIDIKKFLIEHEKRVLKSMEDNLNGWKEKGNKL